MIERFERRCKSMVAMLLLACSTLSTSAVCFAQTDPDELARRHFESGAAYFEQAEYDAALREFAKAHELSGRPQILRNISVVQERLGNVAAAVAALDLYLQSAPDDADLETVRIRRDNLRKRLEEEQTATPAPVLTGPEKSPPPEERKPDPPRRDEQADPEPLSFASDELADDGGPNLVPAYVLITVGGLSAVGSVVTGLMASSEHSELASSCGAQPMGCTDQDTANGESLALTSTILTGVAIAGVGIGAILWSAADSGDEAAHRSRSLPELRLGAGVEGGYGEARWRF